MITATAQVPLHQIEHVVWCDVHDQLHERRPVTPEHDDHGCNAESWRPVFTTDSRLGVL